jgi:hypothetical protein
MATPRRRKADSSSPIAVVPDVVGLDHHDAVARLTEAGFVSVAVMTPANGAAGVGFPQTHPPAPAPR